MLTDFRQTFVTGASWDTDDLITFLGQKVKAQGHTIAAEAHSTRPSSAIFSSYTYYVLHYVRNIHSSEHDQSFIKILQGSAATQTNYGGLITHPLLQIFVVQCICLPKITKIGWHYVKVGKDKVGPF